MTKATQDWATIASNTWRQERILVTVKAYPNPSKKYIETVCVAGVTESGQWIRLYPIPYRFLAYEQQFPTYGWIEANIRKSTKDYRPESHNIDVDTLKVQSRLGTEDAWRARRKLLLPLASQSVESLQAQQQANRTSLGMIRPKQIKRLIIEPRDAQWSPEDLMKLQQRSLIDEMRKEDTDRIVRELEKIPYKFLFEFICNDPHCTGHSMSVISWEVMQSYRNWRDKYEDRWESKFRQRYEIELPDEKHDLHFFLGNTFLHPQVWLIIGLFYPPKVTEEHPTQLHLF